jgi:hypothetical protein
MDQPRNDDGTFASQPAEQPTGRTALENQAGWKTLDQHKEEQPDEASGEERAFGSDEAGIREAQRDLAERRKVDKWSREADRAWQGKHAGEVPIDVSAHEPAPLPGDVSLTPEEAAQRLKQHNAVDRTLDAMTADTAELEELAKDLGDGTRVVPPHEMAQMQQEAAEQQRLAAEAQQKTPEPPTQDQAMADLQKIAENPVVRQYLEAQAAQTHQMQQQFVQATQQAANLTLQATLHEFPELQGISAAELPTAFKLMEAKDPERGKAARAAVTRTAMQLQHAQALQAEQARQYQQQSAAQWEQYRAQHDAEFMRHVPEMADREKAPQLQRQALEYLEELGLKRDEIAHLYNNSFMRDHRFQRALLDASKYRASQRAISDAARNSNKSVPPVQKPGVATARGQRSEGEVSNLAQQLKHASGDRALRLAVKYARAKRGR